VVALMQWHMNLRLHFFKNYSIETDSPWFLLILLSLIANFLFPVILYHLGLLPFRDGNGSNGFTSPVTFFIAIFLQFWVTLFPYQLKGKNCITKTVDGGIYLEKRAAIIYYTIHAIGFVAFNVHAVLWHYRYI